jgi:hypothetical protein
MLEERHGRRGRELGVALGEEQERRKEEYTKSADNAKILSQADKSASEMSTV